MADRKQTEKRRESHAKAQVFELWNWLRNLPEYKSDYAVLERPMRQGKVSKAKQQQMRKKWGIYPLIDPEDEYSIPKEFIEEAWKLFSLRPFNDDQVLLKNPKDLATDQKLIFEVSQEASVEIVVSVIKGYLHLARLSKGRSVAPPRGEQKGEQFALDYKVKILLALNHPPAEIQKNIIPVRPSSDRFKAWQSSVNRAIKRVRSLKKG